MLIRIIVAGKPALPYAKVGIEEYMKRLKRYHKYELVSIKAGDSARVSQRLIQASEGSFLIAMDEKGENCSTEQFSRFLDHKLQAPEIKSMSFVIGAADGHDEALKKRANALISLSSLTMMHELATVVLLEQLYRAHTILKGEPYHRP